MSNIQKLKDLVGMVGKDPYAGLSTQEKKLAKLQEIIKMTNDGLTKEEFEKNFAIIITLIKKLQTSAQENGVSLEKRYSDITSLVQKFYDNANSNLDETKRKALAYCVANCSQDSVALVKTETDKMNSRIDKRIAEIKDGLNGKDGVGIQGPPGKDGSPDTAQMIAVKLNSRVQIIDRKVIKGLDEELDRIIKMVDRKANTGSYVGGGGVGKTNVYYYDLSSQLNGVLKTFSMPAFARIIDVKLSSAPVLRPTVDWTADASAFTLTFTSEIDADPLLLGGQSLMVLYAI